MKLKTGPVMVPDNSQDLWLRTDMLWFVSIVYSFSSTYHCEWEQDFENIRGTQFVKHHRLYTTCTVFLFNPRSYFLRAP